MNKNWYNYIIIKAFRLVTLIALYLTWGNALAQTNKPNVIFILGDDQGYGDIGINGNPWIKTPNMDALGREGLYLSNFHTETTCSPSRAGLMTGLYANRVGVWHTVNGREIMNRKFKTVAESFKNAGYTTGIFGKWHLGDYDGYTPEQRGFDIALVCHSGGVGQMLDYWNNDYFGDTYYRNGKTEKFSKYCTDVWFDNAIEFLKDCKQKNKPFFCYLPANVAHFPYFAPQQNIDPYNHNNQILTPAFYGMITNLDENIGRLRKALEDLGLADNTILVYTSDNGSAAGVSFDKKGDVVKGYNAGLRGKKGSPYEGGHREPFFIYWKNGQLTGGKRVDQLTSYTDVVPTLLDLCGIKSMQKNLDGNSWKPLFKGNASFFDDRVIIANTQRIEFLTKWKDASIMYKNWRLQTNGKKRELYNIAADSGERNNIAGSNTALVSMLEKYYEAWWANTAVDSAIYNAIDIGQDDNREVEVASDDCHDAEEGPAWNQFMVRNGEGTSSGFWALNVKTNGRYLIELRRYPKESGLKINAQAEKGDAVPGSTPPYPIGKALNISHANVEINGQKMQCEVSPEDFSEKFEINLTKGPAKLYATFTNKEGLKRDAYYVYITKK